MGVSYICAVSPIQALPVNSCAEETLHDPPAPTTSVLLSQFQTQPILASHNTLVLSGGHWWWHVTGNMVVVVEINFLGTNSTTQAAIPDGEQMSCAVTRRF